MEKWYQSYHSQCWYKNSYLVNYSHQVDSENSIYNSGCHFTCVAMMLNTNPALLASELSKIKFFEKDKDENNLVWDKNKPNEENPNLFISKLITANGEIIKNIKLSFIERHNLCKKGLIKLISEKKDSEIKYGFICGNQEHSLLIAGINKSGNYYVWEPDTSWADENQIVEKNMNGQFDLDWVLKEYSDGKKLQVWCYSIEFNVFI